MCWPLFTCYVLSQIQSQVESFMNVSRASLKSSKILWPTRVKSRDLSPPPPHLCHSLYEASNEVNAQQLRPPLQVLHGKLTAPDCHQFRCHFGPKPAIFILPPFQSFSTCTHQMWWLVFVVSPYGTPAKCTTVFEGKKHLKITEEVRWQRVNILSQIWLSYLAEADTNIYARPCLHCAQIAKQRARLLTADGT